MVTNFLFSTSGSRVVSASPFELPARAWRRDGDGASNLHKVWPVACWLISGLVAIASLGGWSVTRTQEARVLETARQMSGTGLTGRLVPQLNGRPRLQKPPLAYWLADASYAVFGVGVVAGRLPFALAAWLTAGLTYRIGSHHFGRRAGLFAMSGVLGCVIGSRYGLLAETDVLATLWITAAAYAYWRGVDAAPSFRLCAGWLHLAALATALAILSKGPPAAFAVLFFAAYACSTRRRRVLWWWVKCGAPLTIFALSAPWFLYVATAVNSDTFAAELKVATLGGGHREFFGTYFAHLALDLMPWTATAVAAIYFAAMRFRRNKRLSALVLWTLAILVPLCLAGQKQRHYLLPIVPPLMLLSGWYIDRALHTRSTAMHRTLIGVMVSSAWIVLAVAAIAAPLAGGMIRGQMTIIDGAAFVALALAAAAIHEARRRGGLAAGMLVLAAAASPLVVLIQGVWTPTLDRVTTSSIAADIDAAFRDRSRRLIGRETLPLQFHLRCSPVSLKTIDEVTAAAFDDNQALFIESARDSAPLCHPSLELVRAYAWGKGTVRVYQVVR